MQKLWRTFRIHVEKLGQKFFDVNRFVDEFCNGEGRRERIQRKQEEENEVYVSRVSGIYMWN